MDMKKLIEKMDQFAGQAVGQKPGDQVRGTEKATPKKSGKHPFAGRLVGASESKSLLADLEKELVEGAVKRGLKEEFESFKSQGVAEGSLEEVDRRGFLKGMGAAAVAATFPMGAKAQSTDYVQLANYAVQKANEIVTSYASVMTSQRRSYFANYTRENVYNVTIWYLNNTSGYNAEQAINYSLSSAKRECDGLSTGIGDFIGGAGLRDNLGMKVVNTFVQTYHAGIQQKFNEAKQSSSNQQKQSSSQSDITSTPVDTQKVVMDSLMLYYYCKGFPSNQACETIKSEIGKYIQTNNQKDAINSLYSKTSEELDRWKVNEKDKWDKLGNIITKDSASIIQSMQKINSTKKPEFESVEQGVAEGAPELLKAEIPLVRQIEKEMAAHGYEKGTEEYKKVFDHMLSFHRKFGNADRINQKDVSEGQLGEISFANELDDTNYSQDDLLKIGKVVGQIEGNDVMMATSGSDTVYFLVIDGKITSFLGFKNKNLKNIKNFTNSAGVVRALIGFLVHVKKQKIVISSDEPLTPSGLKWLTHIIDSPRGLTISDESGKPVDSIALKKEWDDAKKSGESGSTTVIISENSKFGNKLRENEELRQKKSLLMPVKFYNVHDRQDVSEGMTPDNMFLDKASRVKQGDKVVYKGQVVGIATGEVTDGNIAFKPIDDDYPRNKHGIAILPVDNVYLREDENPRIDLTPNYPNYSKLIGEFVGVKGQRAQFKIVAAELKPGQGETEKIVNAVASGKPILVDISRVKNRAVMEHIVKHGSGYRLLSHKGKNLGDFPSHAAAEKHEHEVQYFKHAHEDVEMDETRVMHSDQKVNLYYKPDERMTKAQLVAKLIPNSKVNKYIQHFVEKFGVNARDFEASPAGRNEYEVTEQGVYIPPAGEASATDSHSPSPIGSIEMDEQEEFGYKKLHPEIFKARQKYPAAKSDMEALIMSVRDEEHDDVNRLDTVNDREDAEIDALDHEEDYLQSQIRSLKAQISKLEKLASARAPMEEDVPAPVATAGGPAGATQPNTQQQPNQPVDPAQMALQKQQQAKLQQNLAGLKTAGVQIDPAKAAQSLQKSDAGAPLNAMDKDTIAKMAPAIGNVMSNPSTATQLNTLIKKAGGGV